MSEPEKKTGGKPWFRPKLYGYGSGLPCSWEGWALIAGLFAALFLAQRIAFALFDKGTASGVWLGAATVLLIGFAIIARAKTDGGWRWRNGKY